MKLENKCLYCNSNTKNNKMFLVLLGGFVCRSCGKFNCFLQYNELRNRLVLIYFTIPFYINLLISILKDVINLPMIPFFILFFVICLVTSYLLLFLLYSFLIFPKLGEKN